MSQNQRPGLRCLRVLVLTAIMAVLVGPADAGVAFEQLVKEAGARARGAVVVPLEAPGDSERQALSFGEWKSLQSPPDAHSHSDESNRRRLTPGEIALLKPIFRDGVKYSKVWIYRVKWNVFQPDNVIMAPNGNIYWPPSAGYSPDFSLSGLRWYLVHEMTHVYQYQQGISVIGRRLAEGGTYSYVLDPAKTMNDYTIEQQGNMVADYYDCTLRRSVAECSKRFSPTMAGFLEDAHWLRKDEARRRLEREEQERRSGSSGRS